MEPLHPSLQVPVIAAHMLDVICPPLPHGCAPPDALSLAPLAETGIHPGAIAAQYRIRGDKRLQHCPD